MEKSLDSGEDSHNRQIGVLLRIFGDVVADGAEVARRLWRPCNLHQSPKRLLASSWGRPSDLSNSANPLSILAKKTSLSIASSTVASAGMAFSGSIILSRVNGSFMTLLSWRLSHPV